MGLVLLACRYYANTETYLKAVALKRMPPNLQTVDMLKAGNVCLLQPNQLSYVSTVFGDPCSKYWH